MFRDGISLFGGSATCADFDGPDCTPTSCCDRAANTWTFLRDGFSQYDLAAACIPTTERVKLKVTRLRDPEGDERFSFEAWFQLPAGSDFGAIDPRANGLTFFLSNPLGTLVAAEVPGGVSDPSTHVGWKGNRAGTKWMFKNAGGTSDGIVKVGITDMSKAATGLVKVQVQGKDGVYHAGVDVTPAIVLPGIGQCIEVPFGGPAPLPTCVLNGSGTTLKCQ